MRLLLFVLFTLALSNTHAQAPITEEQFYLFILKQSVRDYPEKANNTLNNEVNSYPYFFDRQNYQRSRSNEFSRNAYDNKTRDVINSKINSLNYKTLFSYGAMDQFSEYNFSDNSFSTEGNKLFKFPRLTSLHYVIDNNSDSYLSLKFYISPEKAKNLIDSKTDSYGKTDRKIYKVTYFNIKEATKFPGYISIYVHKVEFYSDESRRQKIYTLNFDSKNAEMPGNLKVNKSLPKSNFQLVGNYEYLSQCGGSVNESSLNDYILLSEDLTCTVSIGTITLSGIVNFDKTLPTKKLLDIKSKIQPSFGAEIILFEKIGTLKMNSGNKTFKYEVVIFTHLGGSLMCLYNMGEGSDETCRIYQ
ncbi:MAG: DUF4852 domain-containing protein [Chitinophagaceae bacterium]|nr:DUF4852 domain-containing protein [Chitinophagaceae bacterium]